MASIDEYFKAMVTQKASDFHLTSGTYPMFRISGTMTPVSDQIFNIDIVKGLIYEIMPERNRKEWEETNDTDFAYEITDVARYRCNVFADKNGISAVFRLILCR